MEIMFIGGDLRQLSALELFKKEGYAVSAYGFSLKGIEDAPLEVRGKVAVLPLPALSSEGTLNMPYASEKLTPMQTVKILSGCMLAVCGRPGAYFAGLLEQSGISVKDMMQDEAFTVENARLTAEAAVNCIQSKCGSLYKKDVLLLGYGRITRMLLPILQAIGAQVSVATRSAASAEWIAATGARPVKYDDVQHAQMIINTAPALVLDRERLKETRTDVHIFELASAPYGMDFNAANELNRTCYIESGLPGRYFKNEAAYALKNAIVRAISEVQNES